MVRDVRAQNENFNQIPQISLYYSPASSNVTKT